MGQRVSRTDFEHSYTDEPHASRRKEILKRHPEVKTLFGPDPWLAVWVLLLVAFQISSLFVVYHLNWMQTLLLAYCVGGTLNHTLMLAIHEIAHSLAFGYKYPLANKALGIFANLPLGFPMSVTFKFYHLEHHRYQGVRELDMDIPTKLEADLFSTTFGKFVWMILQPVFYTLRPLFARPRMLTVLELTNTLVQIAFDAAVYYYFGGRTLLYLCGGSLLAMGLHPVAGHFISEHYMFTKGQETYSYYGPLNILCFNVGYHNEHHDFPFVAGARLPALRAMAPEFYSNLPKHESWVKVIYDFIMDPSIGPYARIVRERYLCRSAAVDDAQHKAEPNLLATAMEASVTRANGAAATNIPADKQD